MSTDTITQVASAAVTLGNQRGQGSSTSQVQTTTPVQMTAPLGGAAGKTLPQFSPVNSTESDSGQQKVNEEDVSQAIKNLNDYAQNINRQLQFSVDDVTGQTVIKVLDSETQKTIRQIPTEEILNLARNLHDGSADDKGKLLEITV